MISPFSSNQQYSFSGTCEHTLFSFCNESLGDLEIVGDFLSSDLSNGRIGAKVGDRVFVYTEDGSVEVQNAAVVSVSGNTTDYEGGVSVTVETGRVTFEIDSFGGTATVEIIASPDMYTIQFPAMGPMTCGLCGSLDGSLIYRDGMSMADILNKDEVMEFTSSYVVQPVDQVLREEHRRICGSYTYVCVCLCVYLSTISTIKTHPLMSMYVCVYVCVCVCVCTCPPSPQSRHIH